MFKTVFPLSLIVGLRFLGLFIVLPVLSAYALTLEGANEFLVGVAVGGYALTQTIFQVPFGIASDKFGRKKTIFVGLAIFAIGSIICAISDSIYTLMLGRFLQGAGAVGAVVSAMIADLVKEESRAHAMAIMGGVIALSFAVSMVVGPVVGGYFGVDKLFWITFILIFFALFILTLKVPNPPKIIHSYEQSEAKFAQVFKDDSLNKMYITFLFHSSIMTMAFLIIPIVMTKEFLWDKKELLFVYLPAMILGVLSMAPSAILGEKKGRGREVFLASIILNAIGFLFMGFAQSAIVFGVGVVLFFVGFNMFEPLLQSFVSKFAKVHQKGAALGMASSFSYFGTFLGGIIGGYLLKYHDRQSIAIFVFVLCILWFLQIMGLKNPNLRVNGYFPVQNVKRDELVILKKIEGIGEYYINETEGVLVVKYDKSVTSLEQIQKVIPKNE